MMSREFTPLAEINTRQEAMSRCIGPLTTIAAIRNIDHIQSGISMLPEYAHMLQSGAMTDPFTRAGITMEDSTPLDIARKSVIHAVRAQNQSKDVVVFDEQQQNLFDWYTHTQNMRKLIDETFEGQAYITSGLALPAYIACKYGLAVEEIGEVFGDMPGMEQVENMRDPDFAETLNKLSISCNGSYATVIHRASDGQLRHTNILQSNKYNNWLRKNKMDAHITIDIDEVCVQTADGITVSPKMLHILSTLMQHDNEFSFINHGNRTAGSTGCPARKQYTKNHPDDFTPEQWRQLTEGDNPIATYRPDIQRLEILRNPITEFNTLLADACEITAGVSVE